jgi:hypothetical protein
MNRKYHYYYVRLLIIDVEYLLYYLVLHCKGPSRTRLDRGPSTNGLVWGRTSGPNLLRKQGLGPKQRPSHYLRIGVRAFAAYTIELASSKVTTGVTWENNSAWRSAVHAPIPGCVCRFIRKFNQRSRRDTSALNLLGQRMRR